MVYAPINCMPYLPPLGHNVLVGETWGSVGGCTPQHRVIYSILVMACGIEPAKMKNEETFGIFDGTDIMHPSVLDRCGICQPSIAPGVCLLCVWALQLWL